MMDKNQSNNEKGKKGREDIFKQTKNQECSRTKGHNSSYLSGSTSIQHIHTKKTCTKTYHHVILEYTREKDSKSFQRKDMNCMQ